MHWQCRKHSRRERWTQSKLIKKSCPRVLKGCFNEESGFCFEILFLKSTCVRILMLVAGGADIAADVREERVTFLVKLAVVLLRLCSALPLPSTKKQVCVHAYVNVAILTYIDSPLLHLMATEIKGSAESARSGSIDRSERSEKDSCLQRVFKEVIWQLVWLQNSDAFFCVNNGMS